MKLPILSGVIDRRILINYRVDPEVLVKLLPSPFKPKLVNGQGMAGICLIRLKYIRPKGLPKFVGITSENGAHRLAVEWPENGRLQSGVFIPRRDTSSRLNALAGGRIFPGTHHQARFEILEGNGHYQVAFCSEDGASVAIRAQETTHWSPHSVFSDLQSASDFFATGSVGYSPDKIGKTFEGLALKTHQWTVRPLLVNSVSSSYFEKESAFPAGSVQFDNALLMRHIEHDWENLGTIPSG